MRSMVAGSLLAAVVAFVAAWLPWTTALDQVVYDSWHRFAGTRTPVRQVAIVAIDDASLYRFRETPLAFWQPQLGRAIEVLREAGATLVGVDLIQASSAETWLEKIGAGETVISRDYEAPFRAALAGGGVILAAARGSAGDLLPPLEHQLLLPGGLADVGLVNLEMDADGTVRHYPLRDTGEMPNLSFAARLAQLKNTAGDRQLLPFAGPPGSVPRISLLDLLVPDALQQPNVTALRGKVVIIAPEASSLQDVQLTPYARALPGMPPQLMSGGELHAQMVEALLSDRRISTLSPGFQILGAALLGALLALTVAQLSPWRAGLTGLAALAGIGLASALSFAVDSWVPPAPWLFGGCASWLLAFVSRTGREARERARLRTLFSRYVSDDVADLAVRGALPDTSGQEMELTILFLDIRNFTALSEKLTSREVFEMLNAWLPRACAPILAQGGNVDKFIGDAIMAVFGAPVAQPDHARRAIDTAKAIATEADGFRQWMEQRFAGRALPVFAIGIGIHSGCAVVGNLGTERRVEFTAIGDAVNLASRLESSTKDLGWRIVASRATADAAGLSDAERGATSRIHVKGKVEPIEVVEIC